MFALTRRQARRLWTLVRHGVARGRPRGPAPVVRFVSGEAGTLVFVPLEEVTIGRRLSALPATPGRLSVLLSMLAACEGADNSPVSFAANGPAVQAAWNDRGRPRSETVAVPTGAVPSPPDPPAAFADVGPSFLEAMHEAGRCAAQESHRYALTRIQIRGRAGRVTGSDAKQALVLGGFRFPFAEDLLVPAVPLFGLKELAAKSPVRVGRTAGGLCVAIGDWLVWLKEEKDGRFPDVDAVIRRNSGGAKIRIGEDDAARLLARLLNLPGAGDDHSPATLEVGEFPCVRAGNPEKADAVELGLTDSAAGGPPALWALDRRYLHRALLLGFREFSSRKSNESVVATHGDRTYLFALLGEDAVIKASPTVRREPPGPPRATAVKPSLSLMPRSSDMPSPEPAPNGRHGPAGGEPPDLLAEAEALRAVLSEAAGRSARLVAALKNHRSQRKALESAWSSLQKLKLGAGG